MDDRLKQALTNIICNWEFQMEVCNKLFPTTPEYELTYSKLTGLRQALDELRFAGLVTYNDNKWEVVDEERE